MISAILPAHNRGLLLTPIYLAALLPLALLLHSELVFACIANCLVAYYLLELAS